MADVKMCDRCGKTFNTKRQFIVIEPVRYILGVETTKRLWGGDVKDCHEYFDLCNDCFNELRRFIYGAATDAVVKG